MCTAKFGSPLCLELWQVTEVVLPIVSLPGYRLAPPGRPARDGNVDKYTR